MTTPGTFQRPGSADLNKRELPPVEAVPHRRQRRDRQQRQDSKSQNSTGQVKVSPPHLLVLPGVFSAGRHLRVKHTGPSDHRGGRGHRRGFTCPRLTCPEARRSDRHMLYTAWSRAHRKLSRPSSFRLQSQRSSQAGKRSYLVPRPSWRTAAITPEETRDAATVSPSDQNKDGRLVFTSSHCAKMKSKYPEYRCCHFVVMSFGVCAVVNWGGWSHGIKSRPPTHL